jgi:NAD(P)-dependent dehydrogenase (short-subunit alcohol dehydrogenase family)
VTPRALENKVIVIIGGTTGLGLSAAAACVRAGAKVVVVGRDRDNAKAAASNLGPTARSLSGDASDSDTAPKSIDFALATFNGFHGLYHVAGGSGRKAGDGPLHEISDDGWSFTLQLNLTSLFYSNRAAAQQFIKQGGGGSILNMGSVLGYSPSPKHFATHAYSTTKAAVIGMTRAAAAYYAPHNIRFNVLAPALVETPMSRRAVGDPEIVKFIESKQPLDGGRVGLSSDLDAAVVYFLSDGSKFTTGQVLAVDGGWDVSEGQYGK